MDRIALLLLNPLSFTFGSLSLNDVKGVGVMQKMTKVHMGGEKTLLLKSCEIHGNS